MEYETEKRRLRLSDFKRYNVLKGFELKRICSMYPIFQLQRGFPVFRNILTFFFSSPKDWMSQKSTSLHHFLYILVINGLTFEAFNVFFRYALVVKIEKT